MLAETAVLDRGRSDVVLKWLTDSLISTARSDCWFFSSSNCVDSLNLSLVLVVWITCGEKRGWSSGR
jgi:hypothetical protein